MWEQRSAVGLPTMRLWQFVENGLSFSAWTHSWVKWLWRSQVAFGSPQNKGRFWPDGNAHWKPWNAWDGYGMLVLLDVDHWPLPGWDVESCLASHCAELWVWQPAHDAQQNSYRLADKAKDLANDATDASPQSLSKDNIVSSLRRQKSHACDEGMIIIDWQLCKLGKRLTLSGPVFCGASEGSGARSVV